MRIAAAGDGALIVELSGDIDPEANRRALALKQRLEARWPALRDVVVAYGALAIYFDPLACDVHRLEDELRALGDDPPPPAMAAAPRVVDVPVRYGGADGPDLSGMARRAGLPESEVIALHAGVVYRVHALGFVAGFAYMASVDARIAFPRRETPRPRVPAGSVAIAAGQTGIYPIATPGGWHLIGRTDVRPWDPLRSRPSLFEVGDAVRFHPVEGG